MEEHLEDSSFPQNKSFMWKVTNVSLPTKWYLWRRKLHKTPTCPICGEEDETSEHLLIYPWVQKMWELSPLNIKIDRYDASRIED